MPAIPSRTPCAPHPCVECLNTRFPELYKLLKGVASEARLSATELDDVIQETFCAAVVAIRRGSVDLIVNRDAWLVAVFRRKIFNTFRRRRALMMLVPLTEDIPASDSNNLPSQLLERSETITAIRHAIFDLPTLQRRLVIYCGLWGHTQLEASKRFNLTKGAVAGQLHRAFKALSVNLRHNSRST